MVSGNTAISGTGGIIYNGTGTLGMRGGVAGQYSYTGPTVVNSGIYLGSHAHNGNLPAGNLQINEAKYQGYYNATYRVPGKAYRDWMTFIQDFTVKFGKALVDKVHAAGKQAGIFWGDHWIGAEFYHPSYQEIGIDINIGAAEDGVALRRLADTPGPQTKEIRLYPYFFPDVFHEGGDPTGESLGNWMKIRRAGSSAGGSPGRARLSMRRATARLIQPLSNSGALEGVASTPTCAASRRAAWRSASRSAAVGGAAPRSQRTPSILSRAARSGAVEASSSER